MENINPIELATEHPVAFAAAVIATVTGVTMYRRHKRVKNLMADLDMELTVQQILDAAAEKAGLEKS